MNMVALIPARAGSRRIPGKNMKVLAGHPLLAYTIIAARQSTVFSRIMISTDSPQVVRWSDQADVDVYPRATVTGDTDPDILWVQEILANVPQVPDAFAILRPTAPFRTAATIRRAFDQFRTQEVHSIRAVQPVKEHPGKMWQWPGNGYPMYPLIPGTWPIRANGHHGLETREDRPWHSSPTQTLPQVYIQNASLEMAWSYAVKAFGTISGTKIAPFFTEGYEGFDLNTMDDWDEAERLIQKGLVTLPALPDRVMVS